ncbi:MAG: S10 family peptidase, partial [Stellaceae bacterium]
TAVGRLTSPVYLVGESYGGFRVAKLAHALATDDGIAPAGVIMVSPVIEFSLMSGGPLDVLPWALRLPSYAAAKRGAAALAPNGLTDVENFAMHDYLVALAAGPRPSDDAAALYRTLAQLTGIDEARIARWNGRIPVYAYVRDLHGRQGRIVSRYDAGVSGVDPEPLGERGGGDDPVLDASIAPFTSAFVAYARDELGYKTELRYVLLSREVGRHWDWQTGHGPDNSLGASSALSRALALDPRLKVMIAHGVTDLTTPYMMSRYIKDHMPEALGKRIALKLYPGGHMLYLRSQSRHELRNDAASFYGGGENGG